MATLTVLIPAFNEEEAIGSVVAAIRALPLDADILVIDDGSTDATGERARAHGARVIAHPKNLGCGRSVKDGLAEAKTDTIVLIDGDGSYPVRMIPTLLATLAEGNDLVVGARQGPVYRSSLFKMLARTALRFLAERTTGSRIPDVNSGLRVFRKSTVMPHLHELCDSFSYMMTITLVYLHNGKRVAYVPIPYAERIGRSKVRPLRDGLQTLRYLVACTARYTFTPRNARAAREESMRKES